MEYSEPMRRDGSGRGSCGQPCLALSRVNGMRERQQSERAERRRKSRDEQMGVRIDEEWCGG